MKCAKIEVTVNLPEGEDIDLVFENASLDNTAQAVSMTYPTWTSIVLIVVRQ
jgi:hypothetical protein